MFSVKNISRGAFILVFVFAVFAFAFWLAQTAEENAFFQNMVAQYGYVGIFVVSLISGFNILFPIPPVSFVPLFLESGLSIWPVIVIMVLGVTTADVAAYIIGVLGRRVAMEKYNHKLIGKLDALRARFYWAPVLILFAYALVVPFPNELMVVPLGFLGYPLRVLLPVLLVGHSVFYTATSFGVVGLFELL